MNQTFTLLMKKRSEGLVHKTSNEARKLERVIPSLPEVEEIDS